MKIYLAARFTRREEMCVIAKELEAMGHEITSRWIHGGHNMTLTPDNAQRFAIEDIHDIEIADCLLTFTEAPNSPFGRGGRHVEFGYALALAKPVIVVGYRENVFHHLPGADYYSDWDSARKVFEPACVEVATK